MKRHYKSIKRGFLTLVTLFFLAVAFPGCSDPGISSLETQNRKYEFAVEQELQRSRNISQVESGTVSAPPAQAANIKTEHR